MTRFDTTAATVNRVERRIPRFEPTIAANVGVPGLQAVVIAIAAVCGVGGLVAYIATAAVVWALLGLFGMILCAAFVWRMNVVEGCQIAVETIETPAQVQPMLDMPEVTEPEHERVVLLGGPEQSIPLLPEPSESRLAQFVRACEAEGTSSGVWEPRIGRAQFNDWRDALIAKRLAAWKSSNHKDGWHLLYDADYIVSRLV